MSPMCSRAASDSSGIVRRILLFKTVCLLCWDVLCPDAFVMCLIYVPKIVQIAIKILLPHFSLGIAEISRTQPTQIVRTSNLPVTKKAVGCVRESHGKGGIT